MIQDLKSGNDSPIYKLYDREGKGVNYRTFINALSRAEVVLFGELHDNTVVHNLQALMTEDLFGLRGADLILGAEMFEADNQLILDEYLAGLILHRHLIGEAKVWDNYESDYRLLVDFAKEHGLRFIATNIPRRYANLVAREGLNALERLSVEAKRSLAPLPIMVDLSTPGYREMMEMNTDMGHGMKMDPENFVAAQAVKDATMAYRILESRPPNSLFIHYNGVYHSQNYGGIYWYLKKADPRLSVVTISCVEAESLDFQEDYRGLGDFVALVSEVTDREQDQS